MLVGKQMTFLALVANELALLVRIEVEIISRASRRWRDYIDAMGWTMGATNNDISARLHWELAY
jgi:hypothetical protein